MTQEEKTINFLKTQYIGRNIEWFDSISSTNDFLKENAEKLPDGFTAATTEQYAGKGRRGHVWISSKGQIAAFSFLLKKSFYSDLPPITLMCGLAVAKALSSITSRKFEIKWPNDVVFDGKKICGILCESKLLGKSCHTVCGIGINLTQTADFFEASNLPHAVSLAMIENSVPCPEEVVASVINEFETIYKSLTKGEAEEIARFITDYENHCVTIGKEIKIIKENKEINGKAVCINKDGSLKVDVGHTSINVLASEASVRGVMGYV